MKTTVKLIAIAIVASALGACSSSMQLSSSSGYQGDDLYYSPSSSQAQEGFAKDKPSETSSSLKLAELEQKYKEILANDSIGSVDTTIYSNPEVNPYERVLADSYADAYQRRLDARSDPYYGINNWGAYYSNDFWYASAYDPSFYNVIVVGSRVWVEPNYISSSFGWPYYGSRYYRPYMGIGLGFYSSYYGWGYNSWYSPWSSFGYYNAGFYNGYYWGRNDGASHYDYRRRPGTGTVNYGDRASADIVYSAGINSRKRDLESKQPTFGSESANIGSSDNTSVNNRSKITKPGNVSDAIVSDRRDRNNGASTSESHKITRPGKVTGNIVTRPQDPDGKKRVVEPVRDKNNNIITRPSKGGASINPTRVGVSSARNANRVEGRNINPTYTRPSAGNNTKFNAPTNRSYPASEGVKSTRRTGSTFTGPTRSPRRSTQIYTPPTSTSRPVVGTPSRNRSNGNYSNSGSRSNVGSSGRSSSVGSSSRSSSGSSSSGSSSTGSSSKSTRSR